MAGGIDWFRWHHGSVTDPKFQLVARKAGASLPDVLAVWTYLLEKASAAEFRGCFGDIDAESIDCFFGFEDGSTDAILAQLVDRKLIADEYVVAWERRQPKREDETAAERKRRQREREHELALAGRVTGDESRNVTQCHAHVTHGHDRGEESREEDSVAKATGGTPPVDKSEDETKRELFDAGKSLLAEQGMPAKQTGSFIGKLAKDYGQAHALEAVRSAVVARPMGAAEFLVATCQRLKGSRVDPVTVPSDEAARTAAYLAEQSGRVHDPPLDLKAMLTKAKQSVGTGSLRVVA